MGKITDLDEIHKRCRFNEIFVKNSKTCFCFACYKTFYSSKIKDWINEIDNTPKTAICPVCEYACVIPICDDYKLSNEVKFGLNLYYYGD